MLRVTEEAKELLVEKLLSRSGDPGKCLRLKIGGGGQLGLVLDGEKPDDYIVEHKGSKVLLIGAELASMLEKVTLDVEDTDEGSKLVMHKE